ncbi:MAG: 3'-5' exonuclease [Bacteroidia bacterium]
METSLSPFDIIFIDIETVPAYSGIEKAPPAEQKHWIKKEQHIQSGLAAEPGSHYQRAGIYAEFGKIVCICAGKLSAEEGVVYLNLSTFCNSNEHHLLQEFNSWLLKNSDKNSRLCAHNGKEFDFPYMCRRMLIKGIALPEILNISGRKPWEIRHLDTLELWKFGDYKHYTSLDLLAHSFGLSSPKQNMDGSMVNDFYYRKKDLKSIRKYCEDDLWTLVAVFLHMSGQKQVLPRHVEVERIC